MTPHPDTSLLLDETETPLGATWALVHQWYPQLPEEARTLYEGATKIVDEEMHCGPLVCGVTLLTLLVEKGLLTEGVVKNLWEDEGVRLVRGVIKITRLSKTSLRPQAESFISLVLKLADDPRVFLVMLALYLHKMRHCATLPREEQGALLDEVFYLYAPIAHRLGLYVIKTEFEELWMRHQHPEEYAAIAAELASKQEEREAFIASFIAPLSQKMAQAHLPCEIKGRPKSIYSIWTKMKKQRVSVEGVYDKFAIRIILDEVPLEREKEQCWRCYSLVTETYRPFPKRLRDWISMPKASGYESLHTTVETESGRWVEVQIRTRRMDMVAEYGQASHWRYKHGGVGAGSADQQISALRSALQKGVEEHDGPDLKSSLYHEQYLFVFTPGEDIKKLRAGATVLDFAFSIHTRVGFQCSGARVNGKHVPIKHPLENGDVVEIQTSAHQKPTHEWLTWVQSGGVRAKIRRALKEVENPRVVQGKELLYQKLERLKVTISSTVLHQLMLFFNAPSVNHLYEAIATEAIDLAKIKEALSSSEEPVTAEEITPVLTAPKVKRHSEDTLVIDDTISQVVFSYAQCCNPVRGEEIFGFVSVNKGVRIHAYRCANRPDMMHNHPERIVRAQWTRQSKEERFVYPLRCVGDDANALLTGLTPLLRSKGVLLQSFNLLPQQQEYEASLVVEVRHKEQLEDVKSALLQLRGVHDVF